MHGEHDHGRARLFALGDKGLNGFRSDKRAIARKNHERTLGDRAVGLRECLTTGVYGIARTELLGLNGDFRIALNKRSNLFGHMSEHGDHIFDAGVMGGVDDVEVDLPSSVTESLDKATAPGFTITGYELLFCGLCSACAQERQE